MSYYMTLSSQEKHLFLLCSYFHAHPTLLLNILRGRMHGPSPSQILGGPSPRVSVPACKLSEAYRGTECWVSHHRNVHTFAAIWGAQWCSSQRSGQYQY